MAKVWSASFTNKRIAENQEWKNLKNLRWKRKCKISKFQRKKSNENKTDICEFEEWNDGVDEESLVRQSC